MDESDEHLIIQCRGNFKTKDISKQRNAFVLLSKNVYELAKVSKQNTPVYYQHCPMFNNGKGADWLSKGSAIKNPYYGTKCQHVEVPLKQSNSNL